jgi:hypothetical protein
MKNRRGGFLLEMLIVVAINFVLFSMVAGLVGMVLKLDRSSKTALADLATYQNLLAFLRAEARQAKADGLVEDKTGNTLSLVLPQGASLELLVKKGGLEIQRIKAKSVSRRDYFHFRDLEVKEVKTSQWHGNTFLSVVFHKNGSERIRMEVELGRDLQAAAREARNEKP